MVWKAIGSQSLQDRRPFATLERARDEIRKLKQVNDFPKRGVTVSVRKGVYILSSPFELTREDSGTAQAPITYQAHKGEEVRIVGGKEVKNWEPVKDPAILSRLPEDIRTNTWRANLKEIGITDFGSPGGGGLELFFNDMPMTLARYPNEGFIHISDVLAQGKFRYEGDRPDRWADERDGWLEGYLVLGLVRSAP